jgi:hypothetical protein
MPQVQTEAKIQTQSKCKMISAHIFLIPLHSFIFFHKIEKEWVSSQTQRAVTLGTSEGLFYRIYDHEPSPSNHTPSACFGDAAPPHSQVCFF